jgi:AraC-like DNA-binding protein
MLLHTEKGIKEISYDLGFQSIYYFSRVFKQKLGASPTEIRKNVLPELGG